MPLAVVALLVGAGTAVFAQSPPSESFATGLAGTLTGRITDLRSHSLEGVIVTVRNQTTGVEAHTTSGKNGLYRFTGLSAGQYTLDVESPQLGRGRVEDIQVFAGHEARVQAALAFEPQRDQSKQVLAQLQPAQAIPPLLIRLLNRDAATHLFARKKAKRWGTDLQDHGQAYGLEKP